MNKLRHISKRLFLLKEVDSAIIQAQNEDFRKTLSALDLLFLGCGAIIGSGIFVLTGTAAANYAGPAIVLSFIIAGITAAFAGLCYAEMAATVPIPGSSYTYAYVTMGELWGMMLGWNLVLEYCVGASAVAVSFSGYLKSFIEGVSGHAIPENHPLFSSPIAFHGHTFSIVEGPILNLPAVLVVVLVTIFLIVGIQESARINAIMVVVKVLIVIVVTVALIQYVNVENYHPFIPPAKGPGEFGWLGVLKGATVVFFAYIGFDSVSTATQEAKNPERDLPIGILGSLSICTVLYIAVCTVMTGAVHYSELNVSHPMSYIVKRVGGLEWLAIAVDFGAICGLFSVLVVTLMGQPRIFYAMSKDGLLPRAFGAMHPRFRTPYIATIFSGTLCAILAGIAPLEVLGELTSVGTLFAFALVSLAVGFLRVKRPDLPRKFKVPGGPFLVPALGFLSSTALIIASGPATLLRLAIWMAIGLVFYIGYGYRKSVVGNKYVRDEKVSGIQMQSA